jgi:hypothetical protein
VKSQYKTISKGTNGNEILADTNALLNPCGYPEEEISHSKEKKKKPFTYQKYKKEKKK